MSCVRPWKSPILSAANGTLAAKTPSLACSSGATPSSRSSTFSTGSDALLGTPESVTSAACDASTFDAGLPSTSTVTLTVADVTLGDVPAALTLAQRYLATRSSSFRNE